MKAALAAFLACMMPIAAAAQGTAAADAVAPEAAAGAGGGQNSGPMVVQRLHSTFIIAPDFKVSRFDRTTAMLPGVYGGVLVDGQWLIGAGGYWLANGSGGRGLSYGGGILGWSTPTERAVGLSVRTLVGWGEARLPVTVTTPALTMPGYPGHIGFGGFGDYWRPGGPPLTIPPQTFQVRAYDSFFVAEPQADVLFRLASWGRLDAGVGYRAVGAAGPYDNRIRGITGSISLQVGNF